MNGAHSHEQLAGSRANQKHYCEAAGTRAAAAEAAAAGEEEEAAAAEADEPCGVRAMPMPVSSVWMCIEHAQFL